MIGSFEIKHKDLMGRIGRLKTKSGILETPHLFPVISPQNQTVSLNLIKNLMGINGVMTNAYLIKKNLDEGKAIPDVHHFLKYDRVIATDSGAYQILIYGNVDVDPLELIYLQDSLNPDIAVILDIPTGYKDDYKKAKDSVDATLERADKALKISRNSNILWMGPIQGGLHLDLVSYSANRMALKPFPMYALGSPTQLMERYMFENLVDMMMIAKKGIPVEKPLHLFGAGHPFMFSLAVACGFDTFDSASYAIYARKGRYLTPQGTYRIKDLQFFPCSCRVCSKYSVKDLKFLSEDQVISLIAEHNLWACCSELKRIKQAIIEGRLWELTTSRVRSHPSLYQAFRRFTEYKETIERYSPVTKRRGIFYFSSIDSNRPEILYYLKNLKERYIKPSSAKIMVLIPSEDLSPYNKGFPQKSLISLLKEDSKVHICFYTVPYGVVPLDLDEVYPLSQIVISKPITQSSFEESMSNVDTYIRDKGYKGVVSITDERSMWKPLVKLLRKCCKSRKIPFRNLVYRSRNDRLLRGRVIRCLRELPLF